MNAERDESARARHPETGGDAACWLDRVCTECGAFLEGEAGPEGLHCWRCGHLHVPEDVSP